MSNCSLKVTWPCVKCSGYKLTENFSQPHLIETPLIRSFAVFNFFSGHRHRHTTSNVRENFHIFLSELSGADCIWKQVSFKGVPFFNMNTNRFPTKVALGRVPLKKVLLCKSSIRILFPFSSITGGNNRDKTPYPGCSWMIWRYGNGRTDTE